MARPARFVDVHVHLWDLDHLSYPWLCTPFGDDGVAGSVAAIAHTYLLDDYRADAAHWPVTGIVHVDAGATPHQALDETRWLQDMADARGMPSAIIAFAALNDPEAPALLERHASFANVRGIRHIVNWHADPGKTYTPVDLIGDPAWQAGYARLSAHGLSFDCQLYPGQMPAMAALAARNPDVPVILNHGGMLVDRGADAHAQWRSGMAALAALPHVSVKLSGYGIVDHGWTADTIRPQVLDTIALFGPERCMVASDFPTDKLYGDFDRVIGALDTITADFSADERDALFAGNAERIYRIGRARR